MARKKKPIGTQEVQSPAGDPEVPAQASVEAEPAATADKGVRGEAQQEKGFPIVGIGASAGGLAAFEAFFSAMPAGTESGMAFVLVQHLSPDHKSMLSDLVKRYTSMQVYEVVDGMEVRPDCVYIIPPNRDMALMDGTLQLLEQSAPHGLRLPIDFFFRSLARDQRERAICIVLSGTGSDSTLGVRAVKGEGGMVMVQDPDSTQYDGMPRSAIATGLVDYVLPTAEMPAQLIAYVTHAFGKKPRPASAPALHETDTIKKIHVLLRSQTGHDFSQYKENTIIRRVQRRMALHQIGQPGDYLGYIQRNPAEIEALFRDLLIGVTSFFRDPEAFAALEKEVIPRLFANKDAGGVIRVWVSGCSTGEEAYSIAILIQEHLQTLKKAFKVQIFATDVYKEAIERARTGVFPASIAADVSAERLARFFSQDEGGIYRVQSALRDLIVFSEQDVIRDPPFSRIDLISCRNMLIYMGAGLQEKLLQLFHYALNPGGVLFLGPSETLGELTPLFETLDRKWKLYLRKEDVAGLHRQVLDVFVPPLTGGKTRPGPIIRQVGWGEGRLNLRGLTEQALLEHYTATGVLINGRGDILHVYGRTGKYLEMASGDAAMNILPMARSGLRRGLTIALHRAVAHKEAARYRGLRVKTNSESVAIDLTVRPVGMSPEGAAIPDLFLVIMEEASAGPVGKNAAPDGGGPAMHIDGLIATLEQELRTKEEYLQTTLEETETSNEEFQSTNEELETSKEELLSLNEEMTTTNAELQSKVSDLARANNDMNNLLAGTGVGTIFVDNKLRITRFTPAATQLINLIQTDIGRPVGDIVSNLAGYNSLVEDVQAVLDNLISREAEVQTRAGSWYLMRILPYRTLENVIEGAVITFMDITGRKRTEQALAESRALAESIVATVREPLVVLDENLRVIMANSAFYRTFQVQPDETLGHLLYDLGNRQWDIPALRRLLEDILPQNTVFEDFEVTHEFERIGSRKMLLNARRIENEAGRSRLILLAIGDMTSLES
jgi:two-component system CheB/CheR fusion protein